MKVGECQDHENARKKKKQIPEQQIHAKKTKHYNNSTEKRPEQHIVIEVECWHIKYVMDFHQARVSEEIYFFTINSYWFSLLNTFWIKYSPIAWLANSLK